MSISRLVAMEIWHRKLNFLISLVVMAVLVAFSASVLLLIRAKRERNEREVAAIDDEIRKITKSLGFNINILPSDQNLADFHANDFAEKTMPFEFVQRLANSQDIVTIQHLRPALIRKLEWPEHQRQIVLMGVSGVIPWTHRSNPKRPLSEAVPVGSMNLGHVLAEQLKLREGSEVKLAGRSFAVNKVYPPRGTKDDITVWIDLAVAQEILNLPDRINLIQALECNCASVDRLAEIEGEIAQVLGSDVQVIELSTKAIARAKAREGVKASGQTSLQRLQSFASVLLVLLVITCSSLVGLMALINVRERRSEIGILRALGTSTIGIMGLFLGKAVLVGAIGAAIGYAIGLPIGWSLDAQMAKDGHQFSLGEFHNGILLVVAIVLAPLLSTLASWIPAVLAAYQDPASILSQD